MWLSAEALLCDAAAQGKSESQIRNPQSEIRNRLRAKPAYAFTDASSPSPSKITLTLARQRRPSRTAAR